jgi:hypothetical protein
MQFYQKIILCNNETRDITTLYPVNLAVIQQFFNDSQIRKVLADTFNNSIDIKVPPFKSYEHKMANIFADDFKYSLNLRKMAIRAKKDQVIFSNLAESLVEGEVEIDDDDWPKTSDILIILALSLTSLNLVAIIWLVYKVRVLGGAILLAKNLSTVHAFTLQYTIPTTTAPPSWSAGLTENIKWDHIVFVYTLFSFTATILLLYKYFRIPPRNTRVCLEITTGLTYEIIEVLTLPLCPSYFNIMYPNFIGNIINTGSLLPKLTVRWPNFCLINVSTDHTINVPAKLSITPFEAYRLRAILEQSYCAHILILHHDIKGPILPTLDNAISIPTAPLRDM